MSSDCGGNAGGLNAWLRTGLADAGSAAGSGPSSGAAVLAADADRDRAVDALRAAFIEGRLTREEFGTRAGRALTARTHGELTTLLSGLPAARHWSPAASQGPAPADRRPFSRSLLLWALADLGWAAVTMALHHLWPTSLPVRAVLMAGFLAVTAGTVRCAWRVMARH